MRVVALVRMSRRWTEEDLSLLDQARHGCVSAIAAREAATQPNADLTAQLVLESRRATARKLEALFRLHLIWAGMGQVFETHVRFHPTRKWEFDFYAREYRLAVEIHGGTFVGGHHTRGAGFDMDREKINAATELGIDVLEFTGTNLKDGTGIAQTERLLLARGWSRGS